MSLYRIILVDDEEEVRKSIIKKIQWEEAGFLVAGDAENGQEALEKLEVLEPDVVLTDIRMPYMDGLALAEKIHQKYPSVKVVIFSGYDDFEYAQKAIKLNVAEYILKPVNAEELTAILKKIKTNLDEEIELRRDVSQLRERYRNSLPIIREHFLNDLVRGSLDEETIYKNMVEYGIPLSEGRRFTAAAIHVEKEDIGEGKALSLHREQELIPISVRLLVEEKLKGYCQFAVCSVSSELVVIAALDDHITKTGLIDLLGDICKESRRILEVSITIGIGRSQDHLADISGSFKSAMNALGYKAIVGTGSTIYINDVEPVSRGKLVFDGKDESELIAAIKFGPEEKICAVLQGLVGKMGAPVHFRQYQAYMLGMINALTQLVQQYDLGLNEMFGSETDYFVLMTDMRKRNELYQWLMEASFRMNKAMNEERENKIKNVIREARQYILDHYQDPDLSVEKICRHLHMSPAYFSTMFKKETGQTYIAYLTEVRLNKAVELLNTTEDKTYIIAAKVGYQEQNYFSYVFKKRFGVSPTKYRGIQK